MLPGERGGTDEPETPRADSPEAQQPAGEPQPTEAAQAKAPRYVFDPVAVTTPIRVALALIYFHFGFLKFFPDLSDAELLATQTVLRMRLGLDATHALAYLAVFECLIGLAFVLRVPMKYVFPVFLAHMLGAMSPLVLLPELTFKFAPFAPTLEGQYILKNAVVIAAGWTLYRADRAREAQEQVAVERAHAPETEVRP